MAISVKDKRKLYSIDVFERALLNYCAWEHVRILVEDGYRKPVVVERWARKRKLPPFVRPVEDPGAVFVWDTHLTDIPLSLAVMWVAWRDRARAGKAWERYCVWGRRLWAEPKTDGQALDLSKAERELKAALRTGAVSALGRRSHDGPWEPIGADFWPNAEVFHDGIGGLVGRSEGVWDFGDIIVPKAVVFRLWEQIAPQVAVELVRPNRALQAPPKTRGPPPTKSRRIETEMRARIANGEDLRSWKGAALAAEFKASINTCTKARDRALSEFEQSMNSEKNTEH